MAGSFGGVSSEDLTILKLAKKLAAGVLDELSDWVVLFGFLLNGDDYWFKTSLAIQLTNMLISGIMLSTWAAGVWGPNSPSLGLGMKTLLLVLCGGFAPVAVGVIAKTTDNANIAYEDLKYFQALALFLETLPQTTLQAYVGISYGEFPGGRYSIDDSQLGVSDYGLLISMIIGFWSAGQAYAGIFRLVVDEQIDHSLTAYKVVSVAYRAVQTATFVLWSAFMYCKYKSGGYIAFCISYAFYIIIGAIEESGWLYSDILDNPGTGCAQLHCRNVLKMYLCGVCGSTVDPAERSRAGSLCEVNARTVFALFFFTLYMFSIQAAFFWGDGVKNNDYASRDTSLGECRLLDYAMCSAMLQSSCTDTSCDAAGYRYVSAGKATCYEVDTNAECLSSYSSSFTCAEGSGTCASMDLSDTVIQECNARAVDGQKKVDGSSGACVTDPIYHPGYCSHPDSGTITKAKCEDAGFGWVQQQAFQCEDRGWVSVAWWSFGLFYLLAIVKWTLDPEERRRLEFCV